MKAPVLPSIDFRAILRDFQNLNPKDVGAWPVCRWLTRGWATDDSAALRPLTVTEARSSPWIGWLRRQDCFCFDSCLRLRDKR